MTLASDAVAIARAGIRAVDPSLAVRRCLGRRARGVRIGTTPIAPGPGGGIRFVAIGKAAGPMADEAVRITGEEAEGIAILPHGYPAPRRRIPVEWGDHPIPRARSFRAGRRLQGFMAALDPSDAVVFLLSGGGSATVEVPSEGLEPSDLTRTVGILLGCGAPIGEMNAIRRHLSALKGGRLGLAAGLRPYGTIAISDVVGDPPPDIGSGPTVGDPSTFRGALGVVRRHHLGYQLPLAVPRFLLDGVRGRRPETPKPNDPAFRGRPFALGATNRHALLGAAQEARRRGYASTVLRSPVVGPTGPASRRFAQRLVRMKSRRQRVALIAGGETTVELGPRPGRGGRNQEFALVAAREISAEPAVVLSAGTDGVDGPTDAAGAWVDGRTAQKVRSRGWDLQEALRRHSSYDLLAELGALWKPGPTGTNVMDVHVGLAERKLGVGITRGTAGSSRPRGAPSSRRRRS